MTDLNLSIKYKPLSEFQAYFSCYIWFALEIVAIVAYLRLPELPWLLHLSMLVLGAVLFAYPPFVLISAFREGSTLLANADGMVVPPGLAGFGSSILIKWSEVSQVDILTQKNDKKVLLLKQGAKKARRIDLSAVSHDELEKLLLAMELWLPGRYWTERAIAQRDGMQAQEQSNSFTQLWESELRRRYNATTFVPHAPGAKIGANLTVLKQLAFGGFSAVYLAENEMKEKVVVKELVVRSSEPQLQEKALAEFNREAMLLARLDHPQIARVFDHFVQDNNTYMVLQHIEGETLRDYLKRKGPKNEKWVWSCAEQLTEILAYLHGIDPPILHRDFTPDNLVIGSTGWVTLIDFGAANEFTSAATGTLVGKQAYMPIEQIRGKAEPRSDLYALGCVLHFLLTGQEPEPLSVCHPRQARPDLQISQELDDLVAKLTATEAWERISSAADLLDLITRHEWEDQTETISASPVLEEAEYD